MYRTRLSTSPYRLLAGVLLALVLLAGAAGAGWKARAVVADRDIATWVAFYQRALADQAQQAQAEEAAQRAIEARRTTALQEIADAAYKRTKARALAIRTAAAAGDGLRIDAAAFAATHDPPSSDPNAGCICQTDARAALLADVLGSVESRGREMARIADEARDAGSACQAAYTALTDEAPP